MRRRPATFDAETEKRARVEKIVEEIIERRKAGLEVDFAGIERGHHDLMPHLHDRLRRLQAIEAARRQAEPQPPLVGVRGTASSSGTGQPPLVGSGDPGERKSNEDLDFLRKTLRNYEVLERVHYGGQGVVYRGIQKSTKRPVAIKLLLDGPLATVRQRHRFAREVELVSRLQHPNVVTIYESGMVRGRHFFAMEFVDGLPIDDYVLLHGFTVRDTVRMVRVVCQAVSSAHQHGIIHRDLKPTNILVDPEGQPHILDFGLAKDLASLDADDAGGAVSMPGQVVGTLPYLSPEQAGPPKGGYDQVDVRSDIYSLGVVLFELITGGFPYTVDGDRQTVLNNIVSREPIGLRKARAHDALNDSRPAGEINDDLEKIVFKALEKDRSLRYQSTAAFADDLGRYLDGDAVEAKAHSRVYLLRKTLRKFRVHVAVTAAFLGLLVTALIAITVLWQRADTVARIGQAGLQMGSFLRLGSSDRDEGRLNQAAAMFTKAIEIGEYVATSDPFVLRHLYNAYHQLAELYFETGRPDEAASHCEAAIEVAEKLVREHPEHLQWRRLLGFSNHLRGRMAFSQNDWEDALRRYNNAASIYNDLISLDPENLSLKSDLAFALEWRGSCCRMLSRFDESLRHYKAAYNIYKQVSALEPNVVKHIVDLSRSETRLAVWHLSRRTAEHDQAAYEWLKQAEDRLVKLRESGRVVAREWEVTKLLENIQMNHELISRRSQTRAKASG